MAVSLGLATSLSAEELNRVVLRVNDEIVTLYDYEKRKALEVASLLGDPNLTAGERQERLGELGRRVMEQAFREALMLSRADQLDMLITDADVDAAIRDLRQRQGLTSEEEFREALASAGLTVAQLRDNFRRDLYMNQVIGREVWGSIDVSDEDLRAHYRNNADEFRTPEKRRLQEVIVLDSSELSAEERRRLADEIHQAAVSGSTLEAACEPHAEAGTTTGAIDLGWLEFDELGAELAELAWSLEVGACGKPVASRGGWHILCVLELEPSQLSPFSEVSDAIRQRLRGKRFDEELRRYMAELIERAYVVEDLPPEAIGYRNLLEEYRLEEEVDPLRAPLSVASETVEEAG